MKLQTLSIFFPALVFLACTQAVDKTPKQVQLPRTVQVDTANFVVLPIKEAPYSPVRNCKPAKLSSKDLEKIETILLQQIGNYNREQEPKFREYLKEHPGKEANRKLFMIDLKEYKRQLVAGTNNRGELLVWVNCFCNRHFENWKKRSLA